ncbi:hypothetical protein EYR41_007695 [Orbilia oligospora]|uniref:Uncharacterized protein n=1 Tax=Orbilia oligospora TaxID=2813651 RepID=A0A8H2DRC1_ORBOL|nr:hypothetical protein EYR41_007695 [Orbilia oligospora]
MLLGGGMGSSGVGDVNLLQHLFEGFLCLWSIIFVMCLTAIPGLGIESLLLGNYTPKTPRTRTVPASGTKFVINIKEGVGKLNEIKPGDEMCQHLEKLAEMAKKYISMLAAVAPFLMCDCNNSQDKAVARLYFGQRSELNQIVNDAYDAFLLRLRKMDDIPDPSMEIELHHSDDDRESFRLVRICLGDWYMRLPESPLLAKLLEPSSRLFRRQKRHRGLYPINEKESARSKNSKGDIAASNLPEINWNYY